jgi:hypothetical protein
MLNVIYAECHLCCVSFMLIDTNKPSMLSVVILDIDERSSLLLRIENKVQKVLESYEENKVLGLGL